MVVQVCRCDRGERGKHSFFWQQRQEVHSTSRRHRGCVTEGLNTFAVCIEAKAGLVQHLHR